MDSSSSGFSRGLRRRLAALCPHWPLAVVLCVAGALNILEALNLPWAVLQYLRELNRLTEPLSAFRGTAQLILGSMLVLAGIGSARKLRFAWALAVVLLLILLGIHVEREKWGISLALQAILLGLLLLARRWFTRRTMMASLFFSLSSILAVLAYGSFGSYLLGDGFRPPIRDLSTGIYFTTITLSTVGYGDIIPQTPETRWFVISLVVIGLGVFTTTIASAVGPKISEEIHRVFHPREKTMELKDHVILAGDGAIARNTAKELVRRGIPFIHVLHTPEESRTPDQQVPEGDVVNDAVLQNAGIGRARLVIAAGEDDGENAFISLVAKDLNPNVRVLAVASSALSIRRLKLARADVVFSPAAVGSRLLADLVQGNQVSAELRDLVLGNLDAS